MSSFIEKVATLCRSYPFEEKWLIAPTQGIGQQWLLWAARVGGAILNLKTVTLKSLALSTIAAEAQQNGLRVINPSIEALLIKRIIAENDIRSAAKINALKLDIQRSRKGVPGTKSEHITRYEELMLEWGILDERALFEEARELVAERPWPEDVLFFVPSSIIDTVGSGANAFVGCLPEELTISIEEQRSPDIDDFEIEVFRSVSRTDEVMTVLRHSMADGALFDDVEILYTSSDIYLPLLRETKELFQAREDNIGPLEMTFAEGFAASYTRPGQALMAWVDWIEDDYSSFRLYGLIENGLLDFPFQETHCMTYQSLAAHLRAIPQVSDKSKLLSVINEVEVATEKYIERLQRSQEFDSDVQQKHVTIQHAKARQVAMLHLGDVLQQLFAATPIGKEESPDYVECALEFLSKCVRTVDEYDIEAVTVLTTALEECRSLLTDFPDLLSPPTMLNWLRELPRLLSVGAKTAQAGKVHIAPFVQGGHTGRRYTYVIGLDEESCQYGYSDDYWWLLLGRVRGRLTASYTMVRENSERELLPSSAFMKAFRQYCYSPDADYRTLTVEPPPLAISLPAVEREALSPAEWLTYKLADCSLFDGWKGPFEDRIIEKVKKKSVRGALSSKASAKILGHLFPHLEHGIKCHQARMSSLLTPYDGLVNPLEDEHYPFAENGFVVSPKSLETLAHCPMRFFWEYILRIEPTFSPEDYVKQWLTPQTFDTLLHDVFHRFCLEIKAANERPTFDKHWPLLEELLHRSIAGMKTLLPPPNADTFQQTVDVLEEAAQIFLIVEEGVGEEWRPEHLGVAIGTTTALEGTKFDTEEPFLLQLDEGMAVRVRAQIDRVDRYFGQTNTDYSVTDYKTDPVLPYLIPASYSIGYRIEHVLKFHLLQTRLSVLEPEARMLSYRWFFPRRRDCGRRLGFAEECLGDGLEVLKNLLYVASAGAFLQTDDCYHQCKECHWFNYCDTSSCSMAQRTTKVENEKNEDLLFLRSLRTGEREE